MQTQRTTAPPGAAHALEPTDGPLLPEEVQLAFRNRGMPLEAMRYDLTPTGVHFLVAHWDLPAVDPARWRLKVGGRVREPLELTLDELHARPRRTTAVTPEYAGNGRGWLRPRPVSLRGSPRASVRRVDRHAAARPARTGRASKPRPSRSSFALPTAGSRATRSRRTRGASPSTRLCAPRCCSPTR
jgi:hypothetical protein